MESLLHRAPGAARTDELGKRSSFCSSMRFAHLALAQLKEPVPSANLRCEGATFRSWVGVLGSDGKISDRVIALSVSRSFLVGDGYQNNGQECGLAPETPTPRAAATSSAGSRQNPIRSDLQLQPGHCQKSSQQSATGFASCPIGLGTKCPTGPILLVSPSYTQAPKLAPKNSHLFYDVVACRSKHAGISRGASWGN
jgi:hypothetical protein